MNAIFTADYYDAERRDERTGFLLGLAVSCGVHGIALAAALAFYAEREAKPPPVVSSPPPLIARVMTQTDAAVPQVPRGTAAASAVRSETPAGHVRKAVAPMPPLVTNVRQPVVQERPAETAVSESADPAQVPQRVSVGAAAGSNAEPAQAAGGDPVVPPSFNAAYLDNPAPVYPPAARRLREEGRVLLLVDVAPDGVPQQVRLAASSGSPRLDEAALNAVRRWRFLPARKGTTAVPAQVLVPIVFGLTG